MGLDKVRKNAGLQFLRPAFDWLLPTLIAATSLAIAAFGAAGRDLLRYDRDAVGNGDLWRLITAHVTHLGAAHLLLNVAGLVLVWLLVGPRFRATQWLVVAAVCVASIDLGFWILDVHLQWYVGLSGLLHGLLVAGAVAGLRQARGESLAILAIVVLKLGWEQLVGPLPGSEASAGGHVIVNAHFYGAIGGLIAGVLLRHRVRASASI